MTEAGMAVSEDHGWTLVDKCQRQTSDGLQARPAVVDADAESDNVNLAEVFNTHSVVEKFKQWRKAMSGESQDMASETPFTLMQVPWLMVLTGACWLVCSCKVGYATQRAAAGCGN